MPIKKSASKALRQTKKRGLKNRKAKERIKRLIKDFKKAIEKKEKDKAKELFPKIQTILDKAAKRNIIKKNKAARLKSRLAKRLKSLL